MSLSSTITARSMTFFSSRTLPGQTCSSRIVTVSSAMRLRRARKARARQALPLPDSPRRRIETSWSRTFSSVSRRARIAASPVRTTLRRLFATDIARRFGLAGELGGDVRRVAPEALQPVKPPRLLGEDVDDDVAEVDQDPAPRRRPLDEKRLELLLGAHFLHDGVGDGVRLAFARG